MTICLCDISALAYFRASDGTHRAVAESARTSRIDGCAIPRSGQLDALLKRSGVAEPPVHLLVGSAGCSHTTKGVVRHVHSGDLPPRSLVRIDEDLLVCSPELCFALMARSLSEIDLVLLGYELCATYVLDARSPKGFRNTDQPLADRTGIARTVESLSPARGVARARRAIESVRERSRSPMETAMAMMLLSPRRLGGIGFERATLNHPVQTSEGTKLVDLCWENRGLGLEYLGSPYHSGARAEARDGRRGNKLLASGMRIIEVRYDDLRFPKLFDELVSDIARILGVRVRIRSESFLDKQNVLRAKVLPPLRRFDRFA